ncbi:MAG: hypothetical protein LJE56_10690 [Acidiferrobacterales bacterium]|nr:hypothetical protein [Acidiferrobacterales bacterium]
MNLSTRIIVFSTMALLATLTSGCNMSLKNTPASIKDLVPVGSRFVLNQPIEIPQDRKSTYIFRGKVVSYNDVDVYYPHCRIILNKVSAKARVITPDSFELTKVNEWEDYTSIRPTRVASLDVADLSVTGGISVGVGVGDGGPSLIKYATILSLRSDKQPEVKEMVCLHWGDRGFQFNALTLEELKSALGNIFTIEIKPAN